MSAKRAIDLHTGSVSVNGIDTELATVGTEFRPEIDLSKIPPRADIALDDYYQIVPKLRPVVRSDRGRSAIGALVRQLSSAGGLLKGGTSFVDILWGTPQDVGVNRWTPQW